MVLAVALSIVAQPVLAETAMFEATRDNTLYEDAEGSLSNGSGDYLFVGRTVSNGLRRAVVAFDDLSSIPAGSTIDSVRLHLQLSREQSTSTTLAVWRLVSDWGEGASDADGAEGGGTTAAAGDATWIHTFFDDQFWLSAGGDFMEMPSAELQVDAVGSYTVESTPALVADVQDWLDNPELNFGWILTAGEDITSAKRFNSRENAQAGMGPVLEVEFTPPAVDPAASNWSGVWYDPALDGEGFQIFDTPVGWIVYFFGYTENEEQLWLISALPLDIGDPVVGEIYTFAMKVGAPGSFNSPSPPDQLLDWGELDVTFDGCDSGEFVLEAPGLLKVSSVIRLVGVEGSECSLE